MSIVLHGPVGVELKIHIILEESEQYGTVTYAMPMGKYPTPEQVAQAVGKLEADLPTLCPGARLQTRAEMLQSILEEKTGQPRGTLAIVGERGDWSPLTEVSEG